MEGRPRINAKQNTAEMVNSVLAALRLKLQKDIFNLQSLWIGNLNSQSTAQGHSVCLKWPEIQMYFRESEALLSCSVLPGTPPSAAFH